MIIIGVTTNIMGIVLIHPNINNLSIRFLLCKETSMPITKNGNIIG